MDRMETTRLGSSDLILPRIGLGCMSLGTDPERASAIVGAALDAGITHFDSADLYDAGENERLLGRALTDHDAWGRVTVATKAGPREVVNEQSTPSLEKDDPDRRRCGSANTSIRRGMP